MTCVHNFRSALDNLVYEFAVAYHNGSLASDFEERLMFPPIFDSPKGFKDKGAYRLKGIAPDARKVIEELQPYNREPKWPACDPLWKLNELSKRDKHRLPPVASLATVQALGFFVLEGIETDDVKLMVTAFEDHAAIACYPAFDKTGAEVEDIDFNAIFSVGFSHLVPKELLGRQIPEVLEIIHRHIVRKVLPPLSPYLLNLE